MGHLVVSRKPHPIVRRSTIAQSCLSTPQTALCEPVDGTFRLSFLAQRGKYLQSYVTVFPDQ